MGRLYIATGKIAGFGVLINLYSAKLIVLLGYAVLLEEEV